MKDLKTRQDIHFLMQQFYGKLLQDDRIGFIFTDVAKIQLEAHLETLTNFWEQILFYRGSYKNNVMQIHQSINANFAFQKEHFDIWLNHFNETVDENFVGENSEICKTKALSIATVMQIKLLQ